MQPMWWNPNINICLSNTTGLHKGWKKVMQLEYGNWWRFAPSHCHTSSRQLQPNNLTVYKLRQCNPCGATQKSARICSTPLVSTKVEAKHAVRIWELMQVRTIFHFEAGNYNQTTYQQAKCDNATQVVQPKHRRVCVQHHWFTWGLG